MYFFEQYKSGELVSRLSSDVNQAKSAISNNLTYMIRNIVLIVSNIIILFTINLTLTFFVMILVPMYAFITLQYSKRNKVLVREYQDVQAEISASVAEKFSGIQLIKAYSTEQTETNHYNNIIRKGYLINRKKLLITGIYNSCS
jgi:ABC-type multidrug transport system fused ATPase/permease subunit